MNETTSKSTILDTTSRLLASRGAAGIGMRDIAKDSGIAVSVIYHYFENKDTLLKLTFDALNTQLGQARQQLPECQTAAELLKQRIQFQLDHVEKVVAVLKYFLAYRDTYTKGEHGVLPPKAYLHMLEVLEKGAETGEFHSTDMIADAQVMTHAVNGFLLEYYPEPISPAEKEWMTQKIYQFLLRALKGGGER